MVHWHVLVTRPVVKSAALPFPRYVSVHWLDKREEISKKKWT